MKTKIFRGPISSAYKIATGKDVIARIKEGIKAGETYAVLSEKMTEDVRPTHPEIRVSVSLIDYWIRKARGAGVCGLLSSRSKNMSRK